MEYKALKDIAKITMGQSPNSSSYNEDGYGMPFFQGNADFGEVYPNERIWCNDPKKIAEPGDILISVRAPIGALNYAKDECCIGRGLAAITIEDEAERNYVFHLLKAKNSDLNNQGTGSTFKAIGKAVLEDVQVPQISREEQQKCMDMMDLLESIIRERKIQLASLDELIKARFVELFGMPLDKSRANMKFTDCVDFNPKKSEVKDMQDVEVSFVPMECVGVDGSFTIRENGPVSKYYKSYTYFKDGDVLLAKITPCFENGKAAIAEGCMNGIGFGTTEFHVARPKEGVSNSYWIKYMLKNDSVHELATINMTGSAGQKRIQTPFFDKLTIFCPPIELQEQFAEFVKQVDKSKVVIQKSLDETQLLFDSLMQKYFG